MMAETQFRDPSTAPSPQLQKTMASSHVHDDPSCCAQLPAPTCCCASFLAPFDFPPTWPGDALLRLRGGADGNDTTTAATKSKEKCRTVVYGLKNIVTVSDKDAREGLTAMAVSEAGTILAIGTDAEILEKYGKDGVERVEIKGKTIVPGYIDVHTHPTMFAVGEGVVHNVRQVFAPGLHFRNLRFHSV